MQYSVMIENLDDELGPMWRVSQHKSYNAADRQVDIVSELFPNAIVDVYENGIDVVSFEDIAGGLDTLRKLAR